MASLGLALSGCLNIRAPSKTAKETLDTLAPTLASVTVANSNPTDVLGFSLLYGTITDTYSHYCILENDTTLGNCTFVVGTLPTTFTVSATNGPKVLSVWLRDAAGNTSPRVDSVSVTFNGALAISPTAATIAATRGGTRIFSARNEMGYVRLASGDYFVAGGRTSTVMTPNAMYVRAATKLWDEVAPLHTARHSPEVIELPDGKIIAIGGCTTNTDTATAIVEVFNPTTAKWSNVASMSSARCRHTATLLADGRILVTGGRNGGTFYSTTEIYTPSTNRWDAGPALASARHFHRAIRLSDDTVRILGGGSDASTPLATVDQFNPATNTITAANPMLTARMDFGAIHHTAAEDGNYESIHLIGGWDGATALTLTEINEVYGGAGNLGASISRAPLSSSRRGNQFIKIASGGALAMMGFTGPGLRNGVEKYDRVANTWTARTANSVSQGRGFLGRMTDGTFLVLGGDDATYASGSPRARVFNDVGNSWADGFDLFRSLRMTTSVKLQDGSVLICGGDEENEGWAEQDECYRYDPKVHAMRVVGKLRSLRVGSTMVTLSNGIAAIFGGGNAGGSVRVNHLDFFDPATNTLTAGPDLPRYVYYHFETSLPGNRFLFGGGFGATAHNFWGYMDTVWEFDYDTMAYTAVSNLPAARDRTCFTKTPSGRFFVFGGHDEAPMGTHRWFNTTWEYNDGPGTWSVRAGMNEAAGREWCTASAYESGGNEYIIVAGGSRDLFASPLNTVERYDVTNNTWTNLASMPISTSLHHAYVNAAANRLWVFGGFNGATLWSVQEYDMIGNSWSAATNLQVVRYNLLRSGVNLDDGRVFLANGGPNATNPGEVYHFAAPVNLSASGGDKNYTFSLQGGGQGTVHDRGRLYVPPFPLPGGTSTVRVTDGTAATADGVITH